jgi:hypothetical protein
MLRKGISDGAVTAEKEHPLFGTEAQAKLRAIETSDVWLGLRAGIEAQREALLATPLRPDTGETLEARWGSIQQLSLLLHGGPQMILQHAQLTEKAPGEPQEREYSAQVHMFDGR